MGWPMGPGPGFVHTPPTSAQTDNKQLSPISSSFISGAEGEVNIAKVSARSIGISRRPFATRSSGGGLIKDLRACRRELKGESVWRGRRLAHIS